LHKIGTDYRSFSPAQLASKGVLAQRDHERIISILNPEREVLAEGSQGTAEHPANVGYAQEKPFASDLAVICQGL
jgi:hypothetical protein